jgi:hypothetical protein
MDRYQELLALDDDSFRRVDPLAMNLLVAKSIPALNHLDVARFVVIRDEWAAGFTHYLANFEHHFLKDTNRWRDDINYFRLGLLCQYIELELGIEYKEDQRDVTRIRYLDPSDLFLNGVMETKRGTCASMAPLHVVLGWRLGWPVSLACVGSHFVCRYDDGKVTYNIEATQSGHGGFKCDPDDYLIQQYGLPKIAATSGSDLRAITPREMLGVFLGMRARHMRDTGLMAEAEKDYLLARHLFPTNRRLYVDALAVIVPCGLRLFEPGEVGSPQTLVGLVNESLGWSHDPLLSEAPVVPDGGLTRISS